MGSSRRKLFLFTNCFFVIYGLSVWLGSTYLQAFSAGFILLFLPGAGWALRVLPEGSDMILKAIAAFFISFFTLVCGFLLFRVFGAGGNLYLFAGFLFIVSNLGIFVMSKTAVFGIKRHQAVLFLAALLLLGTNAARMPMVYDSDVGFIIPSYGLVHELKPYKNISRFPYVLEHSTGPLLLSASSVFLMGELEETRGVYLSSKELEKKYPRDKIWEFWGKMPNATESSAEVVFSRYRKLVFSVRVPQVFLAAFLMLILCETIRRRTGSTGFGIFAAVLFLGPEMYVRFSYAHWTAPILFIFLAMYYVYAYVEKSVFWPLLLGFCAAWISQKTIILPAAFILADLFRLRGKIDIRTAGYLAGWAAGLGSVALYGYFLNWQCFIHSFLLTHGVKGILLNTRNIPGFLATWTKAALYMNPIIFGMCVIAVFYYLVKARSSRFLSIPFWCFAGALVFITAPWPITRNCDLVYPAMFIALGSFLASRGKVMRTALVIVLTLAYCFNYIVMYRTFAVPTAFYGYNEASNTPATMAKRYFDSVTRMLGPKPELGEEELREYWSEPMESMLPEAVSVYYEREQAFRDRGLKGEAEKNYRKAIKLDHENIRFKSDSQNSIRRGNGRR